MVSWVGLFFLGSAVVNGGRVEWRCAGFCAPRICGKNQVDQNSVYVVSKRVLNSIQFYEGTVNCTYVWCWRTLEQVVLFDGIMSPKS